MLPWKQNLSEFSLVIGQWKSDKQARHVLGRLYWKFQDFSLDQTIANTYFLVPFYMYCSGELIHCLKISGNKNNLRTMWGWNRQKFKNIPAWVESYWFLYKKKRVDWKQKLPTKIAFTRTLLGAMALYSFNLPVIDQTRSQYIKFLKPAWHSLPSISMDTL